MLGVGTRDLASSLAQVATHTVGVGASHAFWIADGEGQLLASGGAAHLDGALEYALYRDQLEVIGLPENRVSVARLVELPANLRVWVIATGDAGDDAAALESFAALIGAIVEREGMRDYEGEDTTEHLLSCFEQIRAVHDLADRLPACQSAEEMSRLCLEALLLALGVRLGAVVLPQDGLGAAKAHLMGDEGKTFWTAQIPLDDNGVSGPIAQAMADGKVCYGAADQLDIAPGTLEAEALDWLLVVPICFGSEADRVVLGCLVLLDRNEADGGKGAPIGNPEAELTQSVSVLIGLILGTRLRAAAEKELQLARQIQETLVPEKAPSWVGLDLAGRNRPANQVGGDYFDYLESDDGRHQLIIADVSGHNMASAMAMVMARSHLRGIARRESMPSRILGELASGLFADLTRNELFITCFLLTVVEQSEAGTVVRYTNAGHNPPLLLRASGEVEWLGGGGPMVGFLPDVEYVERKLLLEPGDLIVMYTDGVTEATNQQGEMLDEEGLADVVNRLASSRADEILAGIFSAVDLHSAGPGEDDVTAVVVKTMQVEAAGVTT